MGVVNSVIRDNSTNISTASRVFLARICGFCQVTLILLYFIMLISHNSKSSEQAIILLYFHTYVCVYTHTHTHTWHTSFYCASLYCTLQILSFFSFLFLTNWRSVKQPCLEQVYRLHFPTVFAYYFVSLCHTLIILKIFQTFSLFLCLLWWSVINYLWCYYNSLKAQMSISIF